MSEKISILVVDDDHGFRKTLSKILQKKGYEVLEAEDGTQAMELVKQRQFGVVLMDIRMPVMDGVQVYKKLKEIRPGMKVIMMTAFAVDGLIAEALKEGAYAILRKPFDIDAAVKMITAAKNGSYIAVVDDDPEFCRSMRQILEMKGYRVKVCSSGKECISLAGEKTIDVFFIDMKMPVLNGLETYLEIKKMNPNATVVIMTAFRQEVDELVKQAIHNGGYCCLYKPFEMNDAIKIIDEVLKKNANPRQGFVRP